jgi:flagellar hook protein FlgE
VTFDEGGVVKLRYSNGVSKDGPALALMEINNKDALQQVDGAVFRLVGKSEAIIGQAGKQGFGAIATKSLELSNVDLSKEFADMIIIQRGYQASSKILNVANSMLDQLFENTRGR